MDSKCLARVEVVHRLLRYKIELHIRKIDENTQIRSSMSLLYVIFAVAAAADPFLTGHAERAPHPELEQPAAAPPRCGHRRLGSHSLPGVRLLITWTVLGICNEMSMSGNDNPKSPGDSLSIWWYSGVIVSDRSHFLYRFNG